MDFFHMKSRLKTPPQTLALFFPIDISTGKVV